MMLSFLGWPIFRGLMLVLGRVRLQKLIFFCKYPHFLSTKKNVFFRQHLSRLLSHKEPAQIPSPARVPTSILWSGSRTKRHLKRLGCDIHQSKVEKLSPEKKKGLEKSCIWIGTEKHSIGNGVMYQLKSWKMWNTFWWLTNVCPKLRLSKII